MYKARESLIPEEITRFYDKAPEESRLSNGRSQLEFARTKELILRHLRAPPATVLDVGGAAGVYALWLAELGYDVHLVDAVPRLVEEARRRSAAAPKPLRSCQVTDARALPFGDGSADAVLLLGPLYHLTQSEDRIRALAEAYRVLRQGGLLFAAAISRWASTLDGISRDLFADPAFAPIAQKDIEEGQHRNNTGKLDYFTTAYFHRPEELQREAMAAGFARPALFGIEGPGWIFADFDERWADARKREDLLRVARSMELDGSIVGLSAHLLVVAMK